MTEESSHRPKPKRKRKLHSRISAFFRWLHIYVSMFCFGTMVFFAFTGITLNHPTWFGASDFKIEDKSGTLPTSLLGEQIDKLAITEKLRSDFHLKGALKEFEINEYELMVVFKGPGYAADIFIDRESGDFDLTESKAGFMAVMNDLHKGRDTGKEWAWVIDLSAAFVLLAGFSGFGLLFYVKRRRNSGLWVALGGTAILIIIWLMFVP